MEQLEIIAWNPEKKNFDFKIARNYRAGSSATLQTPPRSVCLSCHRGGGPLFPLATWSESLERLFVLDPTHYSQLELETDRLSRYLMHSSDARIELQAPLLDAVIRASSLRYYALDGCERLCKENVKCRFELVKAAILDAVESLKNLGEQRFFKEEIRKQAVSLDDSFLSSDMLRDRDPTGKELQFTKEEDPLFSHESRFAGDEEKIIRFYEDSFLPACFPMPRDVLERFKNNQALLQSAFDELKTSSLLDAAWPPNARRVLSWIQSDFKETAVHTTSRKEATLAPKHVFLKPEHVENRSTQNVRGLFLKYCASCHYGPHSIAPTLPLDNIGQLRRYVGSANQSRTVMKLMSGPNPVMPPQESPAPTENERSAMIQLLNQPPEN
jgi:hypothetical protein